jgi:hypothetical protein
VLKKNLKEFERVLRMFSVNLRKLALELVIVLVIVLVLVLVKVAILVLASNTCTS